MSNSITKVKSTVDTTSKSIQTASKHTRTLGEDFVSTAGKVAKFGAITAIFGLVTTVASEAVKSVKELDSAMTEFNKVSELSGESLTEYTKMLGEMGTEVARTRSEMVQASTEFVKSGYTEEQSAQLAKVASLYQNVADSEISAGESSAYLISQMKAFKISAEEAISIIDKTNEVANRFAVSSTDISTALTKSSSALSVYGNDINETIGMVTAGSEVMTGQASKVSKGLRSIGANIVKLAEDTGVLEYSVNGVTKSLSLFDDTGKALSTFDVLSKVAKDWDAMTQAERSSLALAQAGKTQIDVYASVLGNFDTALKANEVALNSQGSAMKENEAYMESIEARTKKLQSQFDLLVNGDGGLNALIKGLLDVSTGILKFIDDTKALNLVLLATGAILTVNLLPTLLSTGASLLSTATTVLPRAISAWRLYSLGLVEANMAMSASIPIIGLVVTALGVMYMAYQKAESARKEHIQSTKDEIENLKSLATQINEVTTREQLNSIVESNLAQYQKEIDKISDLNDARQFLIDNIKEEQTERNKGF